MHEISDRPIRRGTTVADVDAEGHLQQHSDRSERHGQKAGFGVDLVVAGVDAGEDSGAHTEYEAEDHAAGNQEEVVARGRDAVELAEKEIDHDCDGQSEVAWGQSPAAELDQNGRQQDGIEDVVDGAHAWITHEGTAPGSDGGRLTEWCRARVR